MFRVLPLMCFLLATPLFASAQVLIIGGGAGKDCYQAVKFNPFPSPRHERVCSDAIESNSLDRTNLAGTYINRGIIRMRIGNYETALSDYALAEKLSPNRGALHLNKGAALIGTGQFDAALLSLNRALELETQDPYAAYYNLGLAHESLGQAEPAYRNYQTALELRPNWELASRALERFTVVRH